MELKEYQDLIARELRRIIIDQDVNTEWRIKVQQYNIYSPRLDIAVGPYATQRRFVEEYDRLMNRYRRLIEGLIEKHNINFRYSTARFDQVRGRNRNARCFIAIEIENKGSLKHLMGGAINASAMGRLGLLVAWSDESFRAMIRLIGYFNFLFIVKKSTIDVSNLLILHKDQLKEFLQSY